MEEFKLQMYVKYLSKKENNMKNKKNNLILY